MQDEAPINWGMNALSRKQDHAENFAKGFKVTDSMSLQGISGMDSP
jgi:hypothetical protein